MSVLVCVYEALHHDMTQGQFLSRVQHVWIQSFPSPTLVAKSSLKTPCLPYYLLRSGTRIIVFITFLGVVALFKMQSGGDCGVIVIVVGNGHGHTDSDPGQDWLHFT